jgi:hypothetical protein
VKSLLIKDDGLMGKQEPHSDYVSQLKELVIEHCLRISQRLIVPQQLNQLRAVTIIRLRGIDARMRVLHFLFLLPLQECDQQSSHLPLHKSHNNGFLLC